MTYRWLCSALFSVAALVGLGVGTARASSAPQIVVDPPTAKPCNVVVVQGSGFAPGAALPVRLSGADIVLGTTRPDHQGNFRASFRLPADLPPGTYVVGAGGTETAVAPLVVVASAGWGRLALAPPEPTRGQLAALVALAGGLAALYLAVARTADRARP